MLVCGLLLLLTVSVCLTLSISRMTRKKMELQLAADAAAYSQAVAVARTYNAVALMNRAMSAQLVASLGVESAISFSSEWFAMVNAAWNGMRCCVESMRPDCDRWNSDCDGLIQVCGGLQRGYRGGMGGAACTRFPSPSSPGPGGRLARERLRLYEPGWVSLDANAAAQARGLNMYARKFGDYNTEAILRLRNATVRPASLAGSVVTYPNGTLEVSRAPVAINLREIDLATTEEEVELSSVQVTHASRTHRFITTRAGGYPLMRAQLRALLAGTPASVELLLEEGNSYYDKRKSGGAEGGPFSAWGDDRGVLQIRLSGIDGAPLTSGWRLGPPVPRRESRDPWKVCATTAESWVESTDLQNDRDQHRIKPRFGELCSANDPAEGEADPVGDRPDMRHTMGPRTMGGACPAYSCIWPEIWDVNPDVLTDARDLFGQPKLLVAASAPLGPRGGAVDPWNLFFRFRFEARGPGGVIDMQSLKLRSGEDLSRQQVIATGLAYYHRTGHFREPPNLFNPFWRATLIHSDVDGSGRQDFRRVLVGSSPGHVAEAYDELLRAGFNAVP